MLRKLKTVRDRYFCSERLEAWNFSPHYLRAGALACTDTTLDTVLRCLAAISWPLIVRAIYLHFLLFLLRVSRSESTPTAIRVVRLLQRSFRGELRPVALTLHNHFTEIIVLCNALYLHIREALLMTTDAHFL